MVIHPTITFCTTVFSVITFKNLAHQKSHRFFNAAHQSKKKSVYEFSHDKFPYPNKVYGYPLVQLLQNK